MSKKYAIALAGGGAKGSYHIGVWKALKEMGIEIAAVSGTSVGAINGAAMVQGEYDFAYELWRKIDLSSVVTLKDEESDANGNIFKTIRDYIKWITEKKGLDITPLRNLLKKNLNEKKIMDSNIDYAIVTVSLSDLKPVILFKKDIPKGQLIDYILASASFPAFQRQIIDGKMYIDGGIYDNMPVNALIDAGYKDIIAVDTSAIGIYRKVKSDDVNIITIKNGEPLGGILEFSPKMAARNIKIGYYDAKKAFNLICGKNYYINNDEESYLGTPIEENEILKLFNDEDIDILSDLLVRHRILKTLRQYTQEKLDEKNAVLAALEIAAEVLEVERVYEYTVDELIEEVIKKYNSIKEYKTSKKSIRELISTRLINCQELPGKLMLAGLPKYYITNLFIYLMTWRKQNKLN